MTSRQEQIFLEIHSGNPREGPGDSHSTQKAFSRLASLPKRPCILDIGCGPGQQTCDLVQISQGDIIALDYYPNYLRSLKRKIKGLPFESRIFTVQGDMGSPCFNKDFFDLIWAEGSIYIIGFELGLRLWRPYLKPGGYMAVTEITWLQDDPPEECRDYWEEGYPAMTTTSGNRDLIEKAGYSILDSFVLPEKAWWDNYYFHICARIDTLKSKYKDNREALEILAVEEKEMDIFRLYSSYYGYVFYLMQKTV